jgi:uncharacterized protein
MRILAISDTHIPDHAPALPAEVLRDASEADLILHAGDVTSPQVLEELGARAPVRCALGNNDGTDVAGWGATARVELTIEGVRIAMVHDAGPRGGRPARLRRWFPDADLIVFGHSHIPMAFESDGAWFVNPGSPTWKRREPAPTVALVQVSSGRINAELIQLPVPSRPPRGR